MELRQQALYALALANPTDKVLAVQQLWAQAPTLALNPSPLAESPHLPGRPAKPTLHAALKMTARSPFTPAGRAALIHAICHIEFNAINLALDAVWRYPDLPDAYYRDWLRVAHEEAHHFSLLRAHLQSLRVDGADCDYGDFPAHDGLWEMCEKTKGDVLARMALVPRTLEARGLDATPLIQAKLRKVAAQGTQSPQAQGEALRAVAILDIILRDEIGHVAIGNHWYRWLCEREGLEPVAHYGVLVQRYQAPRLRPPFNVVARRAAGFSEEELRFLEG